MNYLFFLVLSVLLLGCSKNNKDYDVEIAPPVLTFAQDPTSPFEGLDYFARIRTKRGVIPAGTEVRIKWHVYRGDKYAGLYHYWLVFNTPVKDTVAHLLFTSASSKDVVIKSRITFVECKDPSVRFKY